MGSNQKSSLHGQSRSAPTRVDLRKDRELVRRIARHIQVDDSKRSWAMRYFPVRDHPSAEDTARAVISMVREQDAK